MDTLCIGFTGTRRGMTEPQHATLESLFSHLADIHTRVEFHVGDCVGADAEAHDLATAFGFWTVGHPPSEPIHRAFLQYDEIMRPRPYHIRNEAIVASTSVLFAAPLGPEALRSGTWMTVRYARKVGRIIHIVGPDGDVQGQLFDDAEGRR